MKNDEILDLIYESATDMQMKCKGKGQRVRMERAHSALYPSVLFNEIPNGIVVLDVLGDKRKRILELIIKRMKGWK